MAEEFRNEHPAAAEEQSREVVVDRDVYRSIRGYVVEAQKQIYSAVNFAMVTAYWNIGKTIYEVCNDRAAYGKQILDDISKRLTAEFGKGFSVQGLRNMRQFYLAFQKRSTLWSELSWSHYRLLMRVSDETARNFYAEEAVKSGWSVRQLQRQINTMYYNRIGILLCADKSDMLVQYTLPEGNSQIYAAKYMPYMPTEEELKREMDPKKFTRLKEDTEDA